MEKREREKNIKRRNWNIRNYVNKKRKKRT